MYNRGAQCNFLYLAAITHQTFASNYASLSGGLIPYVNLQVYDKLIHSFDQALRSFSSGATAAHRENPCGFAEKTQLAVSEARHVAGLMRVNHSGEVCAQALYHGQALTAKLPMSAVKWNTLRLKNKIIWLGVKTA